MMNNRPMHPGTWVRENILKPRNLNVTEAAELVGISRPGFSNFLNERVSATPDMAARLERTFGTPAQEILELQAAFDMHIGKGEDVASRARSYVAPFLDIRANEIITWASEHSARTRLSVLLRTLVNSTGYDLRKVDFPGNDDAERPGWDGFIDAGSGTPWIPAGKSGWEFSVTSNIKAKADGDFRKSVKAISKVNRQKTTFVFVTPQRWPGKTAWVNDMKTVKQWKDVRAYDASDLEQWMETSIAGQVWFADETRQTSGGVHTLEKCWADWMNVTEPDLHPLLFSEAINTWRKQLKSFLTKENAHSLIIKADSEGEATAFLNQIFNDPKFAQHKDQVLVFKSTGVLPKLALSTTDFIAVALSREVEREFAPHSKSLQTIAVYPRNDTRIRTDIVLEPLSYESFRRALEAMGMSRDAIVRLANESGRSLTVLRRKLARDEVIKFPEWAADHHLSSTLVPITLAGAWDTSNKFDQEIVSQFANEIPYDTIDEQLQRLLQLNDPPVWSQGKYRGVISKIDSLFAIGWTITQGDLNRFYTIAKSVLDEDDPALDLSEKDRWAAAIYDKKRKFSPPLREGISETLVLLAVYGKSLFGSRLDFDGQFNASKLVRELLESLDVRRLEASKGDLPLYAEAAPEEFLSIIEHDLRSDSPATLDLLHLADTGFFSSPARTGLLWALEVLAWNPETFPRVVDILGQLSEVKINDNWANKPITSLGSIFNVRMPQTAAHFDHRLKATQMLLKKYPPVGWEICIQQFGDFDSSLGNYTHKPKWRTDGYGFGEPLKDMAPVNRFVCEMIEIALSLESYTADMLCDLIERLNVLPGKDQNRVWKIIGDWKKSDANEDEIAKVREKIRVSVLSRHSHKKRHERKWAALSKTAKTVYDSLEPTDIIKRYEWLFHQSWLAKSADERSEIEIDYEERERRINELKINALTEILENRGLEGILKLAEKGSSQWEIGTYLAREILDVEQIEVLLLLCLRQDAENNARDGIIAGIMHPLDDNQYNALLISLHNKISEQETLRLFLLSPYRKATWTQVAQLSDEVCSSYWNNVIPEYTPDGHDLNVGIRLLLDAKRPRAAFFSIGFKHKEVRPELLFQIISDMLKEGSDKKGEYPLDAHKIRRAFKVLDQDRDIPLEAKAGLEFSYLEALAGGNDSDRHQIPNLERHIENHPEIFVQAIVWSYKRKTPGEDPPEFQMTGGNEHLASKSYHLLQVLKRIPGQDETTEELAHEKLLEWVEAVRKRCHEFDRIEAADFRLGVLLSHAAVGKDGVWPNEAVRAVMQQLRSEEISRGALTGRYNARGVFWRGEGGEQERMLAAQYRQWAKELRFSHPFVYSTLLMEIVKTYESEAEQEDIDARIRKRLRY